MKKSITKEEINEMPRSHFNGEMHVIDRPEQVEQAVTYLQQFNAIGFDTEAKPSFKKGKSNGIALLQVASDEHAFLFRLNILGLPPEVAAMMANEDILKIGVGIKDDLRGLKRLRPFNPASFIDLQDYVQYFGIENYSLRKLSAIVLNMRISKRQQLSNWESAELKEGQIRYAATDAWAPLKIYQSLKNLNGHSIS